MIAVDVEASGVNYQKHSILSVGAVDLSDPDSRFYGECRIWDGGSADPDTVVFLQMSENEMRLPSKQSESELVHKFLSWIISKKQKIIVGQNPSFDRDFLQAAAFRAHLDWPLAYRTLDIHSIAVTHIIKSGGEIPLKENGNSALDLDAILNYVGIPEESVPHNALTGALCHAEVASRLLYGKKLLPEFDKFEMPKFSI